MADKTRAVTTIQHDANDDCWVDTTETRGCVALLACANVLLLSCVSYSTRRYTHPLGNRVVRPPLLFAPLFHFAFCFRSLFANCAAAATTVINSTLATPKQSRTSLFQGKREREGRRRKKMQKKKNHLTDERVRVCCCCCTGAMFLFFFFCWLKNKE